MLLTYCEQIADTVNCLLCGDNLKDCLCIDSLPCEFSNAGDDDEWKALAPIAIPNNRR